MTAYGIDLGTTYSCVAKVDDTGRAVVLKNTVGDDTTPSVVYFESADNVTVGRTAKDSALIFPDLVAALVKRDMGDADVHWEYHGKRETPESVSALILRELASAAAKETGEQVHDVVITVPAYFGIAEREATRRAGQMAGLEVLDVLAEPVAAALHYQALNDTGATRHLLVYDLGGGTFDTTVIRLSGDDVEVICTDGDHRLGGADWDAKIISFLLEAFEAQQPDIDPGTDEHGMQDLAGTVETLKKDLSRTQSRKVVMRFGGKAVPVEVTRSRLEELTQVLLERTMEITGRTIKTAREKGVERFDDVLLVGGMTRMPVIAATLSERFGLAPKLHEPDLAVAKGAAIFAVVKQVKVRMPADASPAQAQQAARQVADQLGLSVRPRTFCTLVDNQREVLVDVWEQAGSVESENLADNTHIGDGVLSQLPPRPAGAPFDITFHMTETGLLKVHAQESNSGREVRFEIQIGGLTDEQVRQAGDAVARYAVSG